MNVYEYFQNIKKLDYKMRNIRAEMNRLEELSVSAGAVDYSTERVQSGKAEQTPTFVHNLEQMAEQRQRLLETAYKYESYRNLAFERLDVLEPLEARILYMRYFEYKNLETVADELNYSFFGVRYNYRSAIRKFKEHYGEEFNVEV